MVILLQSKGLQCVFQSIPILYLENDGEVEKYAKWQKCNCVEHYLYIANIL